MRRWFIERRWAFKEMRPRFIETEQRFIAKLSRFIETPGGFIERRWWFIETPWRFIEMRRAQFTYLRSVSRNRAGVTDIPPLRLNKTPKLNQ